MISKRIITPLLILSMLIGVFGIVPISKASSQLDPIRINLDTEHEDYLENGETKWFSVSIPEYVGDMKLTLSYSLPTEGKYTGYAQRGDIQNEDNTSIYTNGDYIQPGQTESINIKIASEQDPSMVTFLKGHTYKFSITAIEGGGTIYIKLTGDYKRENLLSYTAKKGSKKIKVKTIERATIKVLHRPGGKKKKQKSYSDIAGETGVVTIKLKKKLKKGDKYLITSSCEGFETLSSGWIKVK